MAQRTDRSDSAHSHTPQAPGPARRARRPSMQPPLTPMIDVTFQLLLFFLLTCEFRESEGNIPGTLPHGDVPRPTVLVPPPPDPIRIRLRPAMGGLGAVYQVNGALATIHSPAELFDRLKGLQGRLGSGDVPVVIVPQADVPWQFVVEAFNQAVRAEFTKVAFADNTWR